MNDMSTTSFNVNSDTTTTINISYNNNINRDEQHTKVTLNSNERTAMKTTNVDDHRENQREGEKGERETREDDVKRTVTMGEQERERTQETKKNIDLVTSFTSEQYNCPNINESMANLVSSSFNSNNNHQNSSLSNNCSKHSTYTYNVSSSSSNSYPTYSMNHDFRKYERFYSSIPHYTTSLSSSSLYHRTLDASDEETIKEEILEITNLNHYPTLLERWGDDTKTIIRQEGEFKIEDYVEFEETEPTITEEISYEIIYAGDKINSTREIHRTRSESRNFRKIKKRRIKRKRTTPLSNEIHHLSDKLNSVIQISGRISNLNADLSGDNHEITTIHNSKQINGNIPSNTSGDIIGKDTSSQSLKSDEQKKDLYERIKEKYQNNKEQEINGFHRSWFLSNQDTHVSADDHEIISITESSINRLNEEQKQIPESQLHSIMPKVNQRRTNISQEETITEEETSDNEVIESTKEELSSLAIDQESNRQSPITTEQDQPLFSNSFRSHLMSDSFNEVYHPTMSNDQELTIELKSTNNTEEQVSTDSLVDLTRQSRAISPNNHLTSAEKTTGTTYTVKQEIELSERHKTNFSNNTIQDKDERASFGALTDAVIPSLTMQEEDIPDDISVQKERPNLTSLMANKNETTYEKSRLSIEDKKHEDEIEQRPSSNALTDTVCEILTTLPPLHLSSTVQEMEKPSINLLSKTIDEINIEDNELLKSTTKCTVIEDQIPSKQDSEVKRLPFNTSTEIVGEILATPTPVHPPPTEVQTEKTESIELEIEKSFIDSLIEIISPQLISKIEDNILQYLHEDETQSDSNIIVTTTETEQESFNDSEEIPTEKITVPSDSPTTLFTIHLPLSEIKTKTTYADKEKYVKPTINLPAVVDKQPETFSTQSTTTTPTAQKLDVDEKEPKITNSTIETNQTAITTDRQSSLSSRTNEDAELSSDFLANIFRQIKAAASSIPPPSVEQTRQVVEKSTNDFLTEQISLTSIPSINIENNDLVKPHEAFSSTALIQDTLSEDKTNDDDPVCLLFNVLTEAILGISTTPTADETIETPLASQDIQLSLNYLIENIHQQPILHINQSATNPQSSIQQNVLNQSEISTAPIVPESASSDPNSELLHDENKNFQSNEINSINQTATQSSYPTSEISNHIQSSFDDQQKQTATDIKDNVAYLDLKSFSLISNLPSREYRPVFGISDEVDNTIDDSTYYIDRTLQSMLSDEVKPNIYNSFKEPQLIETFKDHQSIVSSDDKKILHEHSPSIISNLHSDFPSSLLFAQTHILTEPLLQLPPSSPINKNESMTSITEGEKHDYHLCNHVNRSDEVTNDSHTINAIYTDEQLPTLPSDKQSFQLQHETLNPNKEISDTTAPFQSTDTESNNELNNQVESQGEIRTSVSPDQSNIEASNDSSQQEETLIHAAIVNFKESMQYLMESMQLNTAVKEEHVSSNTTQQSLVEQTNEQKDPLSVIDYALPMVTDVTPSISSNVLLPTTNKEATISTDADVFDDQDVSSQQSTNGHQLTCTTKSATADDVALAANVIGNEVIASKSSEELPIEVEDHQQKQPSSAGLFEIMNNLLPSLLLPQSIQSDANYQQQGNTEEKPGTEDNSSNIVTRLTSVQNDTLSTVHNHLSTSTTSNTNTDQQISLQSSTTNEQEHHGVFDVVARVVSNIASSDGKTTVSSLLHKSCDDTEYSSDLDSDHEQQTQIRQRPVISSAPWYSSQYKVAATESERLFSTHQSSTDDLQQHEELEQKPSYQELQVISDDYSWYSSYYTIIDAEAKIARLHKQVTINRQPSPTIIKIENESQKNEFQDEDGFRIVQRRKRIPSSTTHTATLLSSITISKPSLSSDIDLKPVILHGHPDALISIPSNVPQTTNASTKKKHKKKKKDQKDMILFDAPEPTLSGINIRQINTAQPEKVEEQRQSNDEMTASPAIDLPLQPNLADEVKFKISNSFEERQPIDVSKDYQSIVCTNGKETHNEHPASIMSNLEMNFQYSLLLDRLDTLIEPLADLQSPVFITLNTTDRNDESTQFKHEKSKPNEENFTTTAQHESADAERTQPLVTLESIDELKKQIQSPHDTITSISSDQSQIRFNADSSQQEQTLIYDQISNFKKSLQHLIENIQLNTETKEEEEILEQTNERRGSLTTTNEEIIIPSDADVFDDQDVSSQQSTNGHQLTWTTKSTTTDDAALASNVTDNEVVASRLSEEVLKEMQGSQQQQSSPLDLSGIMNNLLTSMLVHQKSPETNSQTIQSAINTQQQEDMMDKPVDENSSLNIITKLTTVLNATLSTIQNHSSPPATSNTDTYQQTSLQSSTTNEQEHLGVFDVVARVLSNIASSDAKTTVSSLPDESFDDTEYSSDLDSDEEQQIRQRPVISSAPWYSSQYKVAATESERLFSTHRSLTDDRKQQQEEEESEQKPSYQELQVISDNYPWYSSYYTIVDAEAKIARLHKQVTFERQPSPTIIKIENESQDEDEDGFRIVQRRKRIPSAITHEKPLSSTIDTIVPSLSPDIDLKPVILHGHSDALTSIPTNVPKITDASTKKKHKKKKKKDQKDMILFDAPEPTLSVIDNRQINTVQPENIEEQRQSNGEMTASSAVDQPLQPTLSDEVKFKISNSFEEHQPIEISKDYQSVVSTNGKESHNEHSASITSIVELDFRYSLLFDRLDTFIQSILDLPSPSCMNQSQSKVEEKQGADHLCNHVNSLNAITNEKLTKNAPDTDKQFIQLKHKNLSLKEDIPDLPAQHQSVDTEVIPLGNTNIQLNIGTKEEDHVINTPADHQIVEQTNERKGSSNVMNDTMPVATDMISNITNNVLLTTTSEDRTIWSDSDIQPQVATNAHQLTFVTKSTKTDAETLASNVIDNEVVTSKSSEETSTNVEDYQQQPSSSLDLLDIVNNLSPSSLLEKTSPETNSQSTQSAVNNQQQGNTEKKPVDEDNSSNVIAKLTSDKSFNDAQHSQDLDSDQEQQIRQRPIISNAPWYSSQYKFAATESERLFSTHQSSTDDLQQHEELEQKPSYQELQVISDNYPWYSSYYTIADAEVKIAQLHEQLHVTRVQLPSPTIIKIENKSQEKFNTQKHELQGEDEDGFHIVQGRKRIPSSTTHTATVLSSITISKPSVSPDIDLVPVILHGHPDVSIATPSTVSQITSTVSKKKPKKKKKKDKKETVLFDAPEPTSSTISKQEIDSVQSEKTGQEKDEKIDSSPIEQIVKHEVEQFHPILTVIPNEEKLETLSSTIIFNTEALKKNQSILSNNPASTFSDDIKVNTEQIQQQPIDKDPILPTSPSSGKTIAKIIRTKTIASSQEEKEEEDNEGFQLVCHHKRIRSTTAPEKTSPSSNTTSKQIPTSDINTKTPSTHSYSNSPKSSSAVRESNGSDEKRNKHKKRKKETRSSSSIDWIKVEQQPTDQETILQSSSPSSSVIENPCAQFEVTLPSITKTTTIRMKASTSPKEDEDNEGFQVVRYRKRINSAPRPEKIPISSSANIPSRQTITRDLNLKPVLIHGHQNSASRSISHTITLAETLLNKNKQAKLKQQKKKTSLINTPPRLTSTDSNFETPAEIKQETERPLSLTEESIKQIAKKYHVSTENQIKTTGQQSSIDEIAPPMMSSTNNTDIGKITLIDDEDDVFQVDRYHKRTSSLTTLPISKSPSFIDTCVKHDSTTSITIPKTVPPQTTTSKKKSKKPKQNKKDALPSPTTDIDFIPLSIEEATDQNAINNNIQQISKPEILAENNSSSNPDGARSISTTHETVTSPINESVQQADNTQCTMQPIKSIILLTTPDEEVSAPPNELPGKVDHLSIAEPVRSTSLSQAPSIDIPSTSNQIEKTKLKKSDQITITPPSTLTEPPTHIEDEQIKTTSSKKSTKRRKKKLHTQDKSDDEHVLAISTNASITRHFTHTNTESSLRRPDDEKQALNEITVHSSSSPPHTSDRLSTKERHQSPQITTKNKSTPLPSSIIEPTDLSTPPITVTHFYEEANSKLDLFLPEYIRQQLNTSQTTHSINSLNLTPVTTPSDIIRKKKQRPKMLTKDHEAKSLLTNEFDNMIPSEKQTISSDDENIHDDDEFIIQTFHSPKPADESINISTEQTIDNILSRGFYLWLHESEALSEQKDTSSSFNTDLTKTIQRIVIQPTETDEDEDSWDTFQGIQSTYMIGVQTEKRIHITHAYLINHPQSMSTPSWLIVQDDLGKFDSDDDDEDDSIKDASKKRSFHQTDTQSLTMEKQQSNSNNNNHRPTNFTTDDVQRCLGEDFYRQLDNNNNQSIHFDDWAHFLEHKNSYYIENNLTKSLECFYTRPFDTDTLISETIPIYRSIKHEKQRYGDFLVSTNDIIIPESMAKFPAYKSKPSEYFRNCRKQETTSLQHDNDDEILISHSNNGLSRQMKP